MVSPIFGVDIYDAKTGDNDDVSVVSFRVKSEDAARDLSRFLEKEGDWIMDSDISTGEDITGHYLTFAEIRRNHRLAERIRDLLEVVEKLTGAQDWKFTVGKRQLVHPAKLETLEELIPMDVKNYNQNQAEQKYEQISEFFNNTKFNTITVSENAVKLAQYFQDFKPHSELSLSIVKEDPNDDDLKESVSGTSKQSFRWLEKLMGPDITVESMGSSYLLTNSVSNKSLLVNINE